MNYKDRLKFLEAHTVEQAEQLEFLRNLLAQERQKHADAITRLRRDLQAQELEAITKVINAMGQANAQFERMLMGIRNGY